MKLKYDILVLYYNSETIKILSYIKDNKRNGNYTEYFKDGLIMIYEYFENNNLDVYHYNDMW